MSKSHLPAEKTPHKAPETPVQAKKESQLPAMTPPKFALDASKDGKKEAGVTQAKKAVTLQGSVGKGGDNKYNDVVAVQTELKRVGYPVGVDGDFGPQTEKYIRQFQSAALGFNDGRIDPGGRTLTKLVATASGSMTPGKDAPTTTPNTSTNTGGAGTKPAASDNKISISWGPNANQGAVNAYARGVISDLVIAAGGTSCTINSTARTPEDQARAMYNNLAAGKEIQYAAPGAAVTAVYYKSKKAGKTAAEIKADMTAEIYKQGPSRVSRHCADFNTLCVVDIDTGSIANGKKFVSAVDADERVSKFLHPGNSQDPAYHIEIPIK